LIDAQAYYRQTLLYKHRYTGTFLIGFPLFSISYFPFPFYPRTIMDWTAWITCVHTGEYYYYYYYRWLPACLRCLLLSASLIWYLHLWSRALTQALVTGPSKSLEPDSGTSLPASLRQSDMRVGQFKKLLKTHLFSWDCVALVTVAFTAPCTNISTTAATTTTITKYYYYYCLRNAHPVDLCNPLIGLTFTCAFLRSTDCTIDRLRNEYLTSNI